MSTTGIIDSFRSLTRNDDSPVTLPIPGHKIPIVGFFIGTFALVKITAQTRKIAKGVEGELPLSNRKATARAEVLSKLELQHQIVKEGQTHSYYTIALCVVACFLGIVPTLSIIVAIFSGFRVLAARDGDASARTKIQALTRGNVADHEFLRKIHLGGLV